MRFRIVVLIALLCLSVLFAAGAEPSCFAIRGARVVPVGTPPIENGTVVVHDGLIAAVGTNVAIPSCAEVLEGKDLVVYPGLVDALSTIGLPESAVAPAPATGRRGGPVRTTPPAATEPVRYARGPEDRPATTPWVNAADLVNAQDNRIEAARNAGFTAALVTPTRGIFAGYGAVLSLAGDTNGTMVVKTPAAMHVTFGSSGFGGGFPASLMGTLAYIKQTLLDTTHYSEEWAAYRASPRGHERPEYDRALEGLQALKAGGLPLLLPADTAVQIRRYLDMGRETGFPFVLYGGHEAYGVADLLAKSRVPLLVSAKWPEKDRDADPEAVESLRTLRLRDRAPSAPAALHKAGARFAFYSGGIVNQRDVLKNVRRAIEAGLPADAALRALTLSPAEILGVGAVLGSIEPGKIGNLVVANGDLFNEKTKIKYVFVDGHKFTVSDEPARPETRGGSREVE